MKSFRIKNESKSLKHAGDQPSNDRILKRNMNFWTPAIKFYINVLNNISFKDEFFKCTKIYILWSFTHFPKGSWVHKNDKNVAL